MGMMGITWRRWGRWGKPHPLTHPLTHPSIQPPMNAPMARGVSANHKSSNRIELSWLSQDLFDILWFDMAPPIYPPNHPPTHQTIHPPIGGGVSTDFKSSNRIKISRFIQVLLNFYWFGWSPLGGGGGGWRVKWGIGDDMGITEMMWGWQGQHGDDMGMTLGWRGRQGRHHYHDKHVGGHLQFFTCVCACVHACTCMCVFTCVGTPPIPQTPHHPPAPSPELQGAQNTKIQ